MSFFFFLFFFLFFFHDSNLKNNSIIRNTNRRKSSKAKAISNNANEATQENHNPKLTITNLKKSYNLQSQPTNAPGNYILRPASPYKVTAEKVLTTKLQFCQDNCCKVPSYNRINKLQFEVQTPL